MEEIESLEKLEEEDRVLFEERAKPLTVEKAGTEEIIVKGPNGGEYRVYEEEDAKHFLIAKPGKERYASYCRNLRRVGEWEKKGEKVWKHTDTEAEVRVVKNEAGFWTLETEKVGDDVEIPRYGFSSLEHALEEAEKVVEKNPVG